MYMPSALRNRTLMQTLPKMGLWMYLNASIASSSSNRGCECGGIDLWS